ncbi:hypothetical protein HDR66_02385 [bacterium]|nr:hypothetical protein [bacterium]
MARKFNLLPILSILVFVGIAPNVADAAHHNRGHYLNGGCAVFVHCNWCTTDHFYYCSNDMTKKSDCDGRKFNHADSVKGRHNNGDKFNWDGKQYYCYIKPGETDGTYIRSDAKSFYKQNDNGEDITEEKMKTLENGLVCKQIYKYNIASDEPELVQDCNKPDDCEIGKVMREKNGQQKCVAPCSGGQVFESADSDNCIACPTTQYQGIRYPDPNDPKGFTDTVNLLGYCVKCDSATSFFDAKEKTCVSKGDFEQKGKAVMKTCWPCAAKGTGKEKSGGNEVKLFEKCLINDTPDEYVKNNCNFYNTK